MIHHLLRIIEIVALLGAIASMAYYGLCLWSAVDFLRQRKAAGEGARPTWFLPVSILKPLKGTDPEMYESLRGHCLQDYPEYEIIFGVNDPTDPSRHLVERRSQSSRNSRFAGWSVRKTWVPTSR